MPVSRGIEVVAAAAAVILAVSALVQGCQTTSAVSNERQDRLTELSLLRSQISLLGRQVTAEVRPTIVPVFSPALPTYIPAPRGYRRLTVRLHNVGQPSGFDLTVSVQPTFGLYLSPQKPSFLFQSFSTPVAVVPHGAMVNIIITITPKLAAAIGVERDAAREAKKVGLAHYGPLAIQFTAQYSDVSGGPWETTWTLSSLAPGTKPENVNLVTPYRGR